MRRGAHTKGMGEDGGTYIQGFCSTVRTGRRVLRGGDGTGLEVLEQEVMEQDGRCWNSDGPFLGRIAPQKTIFEPSLRFVKILKRF